MLAHKSFQEHKAARQKHTVIEERPNVPDVSQLWSLIWHDYKSSSTTAEATTTLRLYLYCMAWKVWKLIQITFGYWDDEVRTTWVQMLPRVPLPILARDTTAGD